MTRLKATEEQHEKAQRERVMEVEDSRGRRSVWAQVDTFAVRLRNILLLASLITAMTTGAVQLAMAPTRAEIRDLHRAMRMGTADRWTRGMAAAMEWERARQDPTYVPVPEERFDAIQRALFPLAE